MLTSTIEQLPESVARLTRERKELEKKIASLQTQLAGTQASEYLARAQNIDGVQFLAVRASGDDGVTAKDLSESIRAKFASGVLAVAGDDNGKLALIVTVSPDLVKRGLSAKEMLGAIAAHVDGKGGGSPAFAQGAAKNDAGIEAGFASVPPLIRAALHG